MNQMFAQSEYRISASIAFDSDMYKLKTVCYASKYHLEESVKLRIIEAVQTIVEATKCVNISSYAYSFRTL